MIVINSISNVRLAGRHYFHNFDNRYEFRKEITRNRTIITIFDPSM